MSPTKDRTDETELISESTALISTAKEETTPTPNSEWRTTASLAVCMLVQSYLLVGVFPYSGFMALHLVDGLTEESVGSYAGFIASSFMVGRTLSSFEWGKSADKYGRVFVIKSSLLLSALFSILFGLAPTFSLALLARFCLGMCNGLIGPVKTIISELANGDKAKETNIIAIVMGMWGYGFLLNPAISGYLSDPIKQYPGAAWVQWLDPILKLQENPFLLPNIMGCFICLIGLLLVHNFVEETLPETKRRSFFMRQSQIMRNVSSWGLFKHLHCPDEDTIAKKEASNGEVPRWIRPSPSTTALAILSPRTMGKKVAQEEEDHEDWESVPPTASQDSTAVAKNDEDHEPATIKSLLQRRSTRQHLMIYWVYSFLVICVDETFPLFCMSKGSGLAIEEKSIGNILSGTGVCYVLIQYFLLTQLVDRFGFYTSLKVGALCSVPLICLLPLSLLTNRGAPEGTLTWATLGFLSAVYAVARSFSSVTFSTITMTTNRTVPAHHRATMNGLSMLGGSLAKGIGPAFAGILFSTSVGRVTPPYGSVVVYGVISLLGLGLFWLTVCLPEHNEEEDEKANKSFAKESTLQQQEDEEDRPPSF